MKGWRALIDKLDQEVPKSVPYTRDFRRFLAHANEPQNRMKVWRDGGHYEKRGDFRKLSTPEFPQGLPVILHQTNRHMKEAGDKVELIETGTMSLAEMRQTVESMYRMDSTENRIMRLDLAADIKDVPVEWFRNNVSIMQKQTHREWSKQSITTNRCETLMAGQKPNQYRIYDKTGHRRMLLHSENLRAMRQRWETAEGERRGKWEPMSFLERWGYEDEQMITRVERQIGGKQVEAVGFTHIGSLYTMPVRDPFTQMKFPDDVKREKVKGIKTVEQHMTMMLLREWIDKEGIVLARNRFYSLCSSRTQFYARWKRYSDLLALEKQGVFTRKGLLFSFQSSIGKQLLAA